MALFFKGSRFPASEEANLGNRLSHAVPFVLERLCLAFGSRIQRCKYRATSLLHLWLVIVLNRRFVANHP